MTKTTQCPSPTYREYQPSVAMRMAAERAARVQPPLFALVSKVPANYDASKDRATMKGK